MGITTTKKIRKKSGVMESDGLYTTNFEHWETWELAIHLKSYETYRKSEKGTPYLHVRRQVIVNIPAALRDHLQLKDGDKLQIAIRKIDKNVVLKQI